MVNGLQVMLFGKEEVSMVYFALQQLLLTKTSFFQTNFLAEIFAVFILGIRERTGIISYALYVHSQTDKALSKLMYLIKGGWW